MIRRRIWFFTWNIRKISTIRRIRIVFSVINTFTIFTNFIIMHDEDIIIADALSSDGSPFITTSFDRDLKKLRRDDDDVIEIFELL